MYASIAVDPKARAKVPILEVGEEGSPDYLKLIESGLVTDYIAQKWREVGPDLLPKDAGKEAKMRFFVQTFMETLSGSMFSFMAAPNAQRVTSEYHKWLNGLKATNDALAKHGEQTGTGNFFFGDQYTVAEALTAPFVARQSVLFKEHRGIDVLDTCANLGLEHLRRWWGAVLARPSTILTTPSEDSLKQLAPYVRPVFVPVKFSPQEQAETNQSMLNQWSGNSAADEEANFQALIKKGNQMNRDARAAAKAAAKL